ncbi:hypothetical protein SUS17_1651 [Sphingomonas sp. S17]|nr:hypothetical protein SUS17_1651 [Sphingomonas sp. S17]
MSTEERPVTRGRPNPVSGAGRVRLGHASALHAVAAPWPATCRGDPPRLSKGVVAPAGMA